MRSVRPPTPARGTAWSPGDPAAVHAPSACRRPLRPNKRATDPYPVHRTPNVSSAAVCLVKTTPRAPPHCVPPTPASPDRPCPVSGPTCSGAMVTSFRYSRARMTCRGATDTCVEHSERKSKSSTTMPRRSRSNLHAPCAPDELTCPLQTTEAHRAAISVAVGSTAARHWQVAGVWYTWRDSLTRIAACKLPQCKVVLLPHRRPVSRKIPCFALGSDPALSPGTRSPCSKSAPANPLHHMPRQRPHAPLTEVRSASVSSEVSSKVSYGGGKVQCDPSASCGQAVNCHVATRPLPQ